jgi:IS605 OrfB family transposase
MRLVRTIRLPLVAEPQDFLPVTEAFTKAFNYVCEVGWKDSDTNGVSLHHKTYRDCRAKFKLPSQLACTARVKATEALLSVKDRIKKGKRAACPKSRLCPIRLDARTYSLKFDKRTCSIVTLGKRFKCGFKVRKYYEQFLDWKQASADLVIRDGKVFLHLVMQKEVEDPTPSGKVVGVDAGIKRAAVTSLNQFFGGGRLSHVAWSYRRRRSALQKMGHLGKRHLNRLGRRENRFATDMLHCISKNIVSSLEPGDVVAMEKLTGIRDHRLRKPQRTALNAWAFNRLELMTQYKAEAKGCLFVQVDPRNTSRGCSKCGHIEKANRKSQSLFECKKCHHRLNADLNGSKNIALRGKMQVAIRNLHGLPSTSLLLPVLQGRASSRL